MSVVSLNNLPQTTGQGTDGLNPESQDPKPFEPKTKTIGGPNENKMEQFLRDRDSGGAIRDMLDLEALNPEKTLDEDMQVLPINEKF